MQDVKALRHQAAIQILTALVVQDSIEQHSATVANLDWDYHTNSKFIKPAVDLAYELVKELAKRDPILASQLESERQLAEINHKLGIGAGAVNNV